MLFWVAFTLCFAIWRVLWLVIAFMLCFSIGCVRWSEKYKLFEKYSPKHLVVKEILYTFALAFTKWAFWLVKLKHKERVLWKDLHKQRSSTRSVYLLFVSDRWVKETNRSIHCLYFSGIAAKYRLKKKVLFTWYYLG